LVVVVVMARELVVVTLVEDEDELSDVELELEGIKLEVVAVELAPPPPIVGGGTAVEGSTRAPVPQGIGAPVLGCVDSVGGVLWPFLSAMVKRVVHDTLELKGLENW